MKQKTLAGPLLVLALSVAGCATTGAVNASGLGSAAQPVRADMPPGQRAWLDRLRCEDGSAPGYQRLGSIGIGGDGHVVDAYEVRCADQPALVIHMDMYHPGYVEAEAPAPFSLVAPRSAF
ncbi:hypothetical protein [Brevundimonas diminuta]|uniref:hypothetical protein n=1 Tax=Brevundimonas diminuta TaxID=293 RepID=UPI003CFF875C